MKNSNAVSKHYRHSWVGILGGFILSSIYPVFAQEENGALSFTVAVSTGAAPSVAAAVPVPTEIKLSNKLSPADSKKNDSFGGSLAVSGNTLVAGSTNITSSFAYLFKRNSSSGPWSQVAKLEPPAGTTELAHFGYSVAIDSDTVVVSAHYDTVSGVTFAGSAYLFKRNTINPAQWDRVDRLTVEDLPPYRPVQYDYFGKTVAISGNTIVVLAPGVERSGKTTGAAYVFEPSGVTELTVTDGVRLANDIHPLAISGDTMVIGDGISVTGSVYTFKRAAPTGPWVQVGAALPGTPHSFEHFGASLALKGNLLVVGAPDSDGVERDTGAVYVFESNPAGGWRQIAKLTASDGVEDDSFGTAVAVSDDGLILVGAPQKDSKAGAAYLFKQGACGSSWGQVARLTAADDQAGDDFANSVAFSGNTVLIGAPATHSPAGFDKPGAVYYHDLDLPPAYCLTVERTGTGAGTVTSTPPGGINCGAVCTASYPGDTVVTLIATPASGSMFKGWNGASCSGTNPCQVTMSQALSVTAEFEDLPTLLVVKRGIGSSRSTVTSDPAGIQCGSDCSEDYTKGTVVTLTATPDASLFTGWNGTSCSTIFSGWNGASCSGADLCRLTMDQNYAVTANFTRECVLRTNTVVIDFGPYGIWIRRSDQSWVQLHPLTAIQMVTVDLDNNGQTDLVVNFGNPYGLWVWKNKSTWVKLHDLAPVSITVADLDGNSKADLVVNFGPPYGIWRWMNNQSWMKLHSLAPVSITAADLDGNGQADLVIDFAPYGIWSWMNNQTWVKLHDLPTRSITAADLDDNGQADLTVNFGPPYGIWRWMNNQNWVKLHDLAAMNVITTDLDGNGQSDLVANFGPPYGLWVLMNNQSWVKLHNLSPASITTTRLDDNAQQDLVVDFGSPYGIWLWMNNQVWVKLHDLSAKQIVASPDSLL